MRSMLQEVVVARLEGALSVESLLVVNIDRRRPPTLSGSSLRSHPAPGDHELPGLPWMHTETDADRDQGPPSPGRQPTMRWPQLDLTRLNDISLLFSSALGLLWTTSPSPTPDRRWLSWCGEAICKLRGARSRLSSYHQGNTMSLDLRSFRLSAGSTLQIAPRSLS